MGQWRDWSILDYPKYFFRVLRAQLTFCFQDICSKPQLIALLILSCADTGGIRSFTKLHTDLDRFLYSGKDAYISTWKNPDKEYQAYKTNLFYR